MDQPAKDALLKALHRLPDWIRHDLAGKDAGLRARAEEALAAIVGDALGRASDPQD